MMRLSWMTGDLDSLRAGTEPQRWYEQGCPPTSARQVASLRTGGPAAPGEAVTVSLRTIAIAPRFPQWVLAATLLLVPEALPAPGLTRRGVRVQVGQGFPLRPGSWFRPWA